MKKEERIHERKEGRKEEKETHTHRRKETGERGGRSKESVVVVFCRVKEATQGKKGREEKTLENLVNFSRKSTQKAQSELRKWSEQRKWLMEVIVNEMFGVT